MQGYPVQNDPNSCLVTLVHQVFELVWLSIAAGWTVIASHLVAPGGIQRMFGQRHEFDMGIVVFLDVFNQQRGYFLVGIEGTSWRSPLFLIDLFLFPGAQMDFVDRKGLGFEVIVDPVIHPEIIFKLVAGIIGSRGCIRSELTKAGVGVCLIDFPPIMGDNEVFIVYKGFQAFHIESKNSCLLLVHWMTLGPIVKVPNQKNFPSIWGINTKLGAQNLVSFLYQMSAQLFIKRGMLAGVHIV